MNDQKFSFGIFVNRDFDKTKMIETEKHEKDRRNRGKHRPAENLVKLCAQRAFGKLYHRVKNQIRALFVGKLRLTLCLIF